MLLAQVLDDPAAADYRRWLNWALWTVLAICVGAIIIGGATAAFSTANRNPEGRTTGLRLAAAGLVGAIIAPLLHQLISWSANTIAPTDTTLTP